MAANPSPGYKILKISGHVSVERHQAGEKRRIVGIPVLIVGPTGSGKSTFIEALANDTSLQISSNQLDGFTQTISAYRVCNVNPSLVSDSHPIYLIDVPGFADTNISQMSIVSMLKDWMKENRIYAFPRMLYFTPINVVRFPGSQREVVKSFQALTGIRTAGHIGVVTSMWDTIWSDSAKGRADRNFIQLHDIWREYFEQPEGCRIVKFTNTQESALSVLDQVFAYRNTNDNYNAYTNLERFAHGSMPLQDTPFGSHIHNDLQNRIQNLRLQRDNIRSELEDDGSQSGPLGEELRAVLGPRLQQVEKYLAKFEQELHDFLLGTPSPGMETVAAPMEPPTRGTFAQISDSLQSWGKSIFRHLDS